LTIFLYLFYSKIALHLFFECGLLPPTHRFSFEWFFECMFSWRCWLLGSFYQMHQSKVIVCWPCF